MDGVLESLTADVTVCPEAQPGAQPTARFATRNAKDGECSHADDASVQFRLADVGIESGPDEYT